MRLNFPWIGSTLVLLSSIASAQSDLQPLDDVDSQQITINTVSTSGSGCPRSAVSVSISPDRTVVTLGFDSFHVGIGQSFSISDREKECNIHLNLHYPAGYSYAVIETTYHGFAQMDEGVEGAFETEYVFADEKGKGLVGGLLGGLIGGLLGAVGDLLGVVTRVVIPGGGLFADGDSFSITEKVPANKKVLAPCDGKDVNLLIRTTISLSASKRDAQGQLVDDDATIDLTQQVRLEWQKCR